MDKTEKIFTITKKFSSRNINVIKPEIDELKIKNNRLLKQSNWKSFCLKNLWILFITILPLSGIIIGFIFRNDCPLEKYIPIWEIINGFMTIAFLLLICITKQIIKNDQSDFQHQNWTIFIIDQLKILLIFCLFAWFICGNIWVYKYYKIVKYEKSLITSNKIMKNFYCNKIIYLYAFWYMTTIYIVLGVCLIYFLFSLIYNCVYKQ